MTKKVLYSLIIVLMTGCFGETSCPEFPESKLNWLPYQYDNTIKFTNDNDTIDFKVNETYRSEAYSYKNNCDCSCEANAVFKTNINDRIDIKIEGYSNYYGDRTNYEYNFIKYGGDLYSALRSDDFYFKIENDNISAETIMDYQIDQKIYKNVIKIELDTIDDNSLNWRKPEIWRLYIADSIGIIKFDDCSTRNEWKRVE